ncbi:MAG: hypothetical protein L6R35_002210 [Caloplaca aegaea]|nr:MAG: hypothetical protein L6R35_002210 [Caloplaca aegaea]
MQPDLTQLIHHQPYRKTSCPISAMPTTDDTWTCHECNNPNTIALAPEKCSACSHKKCPECKVGRPKTLAFAHGHYSMPVGVNMGLQEVIGVGDDDGDVEVGADVFNAWG